MLAFAYYLLLFGCILVIGLGFHKAMLNMWATKQETKRFLLGYYLFIAIWLAYIWLLDMSGALDIDTMPPRLPLLVILPAFSMIAYFFTAKRFKALIAAFPFKLTVYYQSFRVFVELLILGAFLQGMGPVHVTFEGYNFDILAGITAPIMGWLFFSRKAISTKVLLAWNITCLLLLANIVFIFITLVYNPAFWGFTETPISTSLFTMPYIYIAAFYMPSAVFMHVFCISRVLREKVVGQTNIAMVIILEELIDAESSIVLLKSNTNQIANITLQNGLKIKITVPYDVFEWFVDVYDIDGNTVTSTCYDHYGDKKENLVIEMKDSIKDFLADVIKNESRIIPKQKSTGNIFQIKKDNKWLDYI